MFSLKCIETDHKDLIHDVAYDYHGRRMATSSCDQYIKIWDLVDGEWKCTTSLKAHSGIVWKVIWAYPEFGQVIATCSNDKTVAVWEELANDDGQEGGQWMKRGNLVDSKSPIVDVKFAPRHLGLKLAMVSIDGNVRVYEAQDTMNLCQWTLQSEISCKVNCCCLDWCPSRLHPPLLLIGCDDGSSSSSSSSSTAQTNVLVYEYNDQSRTWVKIEMTRPVTGRVRDISFSPNLGRSYDLVAVAGSQLTILQILRSKNINREGQSEASKFEMRIVAEFSDHQAQVWRLSWNVTGTILASSGDDGCVRLWKGNHMDVWRCISVLKSSQTGVKLLPVTTPPQQQTNTTTSTTTTTSQQQQQLSYSQTLKNTKSSNILR